MPTNNFFYSSRIKTKSWNQSKTKWQAFTYYWQFQLFARCFCHILLVATSYRLPHLSHPIAGVWNCLNNPWQPWKSINTMKPWRDESFLDATASPEWHQSLFHIAFANSCSNCLIMPKFHSSIISISNSEFLLHKNESDGCTCSFWSWPYQSNCNPLARCRCNHWIHNDDQNNPSANLGMTSLFKVLGQTESIG